MSALLADMRLRGGEGSLKIDLTGQSAGSRTAGSGAQQAFSVCSRRVSDAPIPAVRGTAM